MPGRGWNIYQKGKQENLKMLLCMRKFPYNMYCTCFRKFNSFFRRYIPITADNKDDIDLVIFSLGGSEAWVAMERLE
jgi:hypothetical protein